MVSFQNASFWKVPAAPGAGSLDPAGGCATPRVSAVAVETVSDRLMLACWPVSMVVDLSHFSLDERSNWPPRTLKMVLPACSFCSCCNQLSCLLVLSMEVVAPAVSVVVYVVVIVTAAWLAFPGGTYMIVNGMTLSCISATEIGRASCR